MSDRRQRAPAQPRAARSAPRSERAFMPCGAAARRRDRQHRHHDQRDHREAESAALAAGICSCRAVVITPTTSHALGGGHSRSSLDQPPLGRLVVILQGDQQRPSSTAAAASVVTRISGPHSTACTQNGGWYLISTISAEPTTMKPAIMMMNTGGAVARIDERVVETADVAATAAATETPHRACPRRSAGTCRRARAARPAPVAGAGARHGMTFSFRYARCACSQEPQRKGRPEGRPDG